MADFIDSIQDPIFIKNKEDVYINCNKAFEEFTGISRQRLIGSIEFDIPDNGLAELYTSQDKELLEGGKLKQYSASLRAINGPNYAVVFTKILFSTVEYAGFIGVINKIVCELEPSTEHLKGSLGDSQPRLTAREIELLGHLAKGGTAKEIARLLLISPHTVTHHLKTIYMKLGANNKISALIQARQFHFIQ